jgi:hypothetical protein
MRRASALPNPKSILNKKSATKQDDTIRQHFYDTNEMGETKMASTYAGTRALGLKANPFYLRA